jgi:hypothetical protein
LLDEASELLGSLEGTMNSDKGRITLASVFAESGRIADALNICGSQTSDVFIKTLAGWSGALERLATGGFLGVVRQAADLLGWTNPIWRRYGQLLESQPELGPTSVWPVHNRTATAHQDGRKDDQ